jgi:hypothetical protein
MTAREWTAAYAAKLGIEPPDDATIEALLDIAGVAAHASERTAAPITCWLIGQAGIGTDEARRLADELAT